MAAVLRNPTPSAADLTRIQTYLQEYDLARWTVPGNEPQVRGFRAELRNNFRRVRSSQTYDQMNDLVLRIMEGVAKGNYHPVARFNAMLAIGGLNVREPARTTEKAVPLSRTLPLLLEVYNDANMIDAVRVAAMLGINRHVVLGIADAQVANSQVLPPMLALAKANQPPAGRSDEGHAWMRVLAIETLGALAVTGNQGEVANTMAEIAGDEESPLWVRCAAAACLGQLKYPDPAGMQPDTFLANLGQLTVAICNAEVEILKKQKRDEVIAGAKIQRPSAGGGAMGDMDMGMPTGMDEGMMPMMPEMEMEMGGVLGDPMGGRGTAAKEEEEEDTMETRRIKGSRRRLTDRLLSVLMGLGKDVKRDDGSRAGIHILITDADKETLLNDLGAAITALLDELENKEELDSDKLDEVIDTAAGAVGGLFPSAVPDVPDDEEQPPADTPTAPAPDTP